MKLTIDRIGGQCPVQGDGWVDEQFWYFRARGSRWSFEVWPPGCKPGPSGDLPEPDSEWYIGRAWPPARTDEFAAGYMPTEIAEQYIRHSAEMWAAWAAAGKP